MTNDETKHRILQAHLTMAAAQIVQGANLNPRLLSELAWDCLRFIEAAQAADRPLPHAA